MCLFLLARAYNHNYFTTPCSHSFNSLFNWRKKHRKATNCQAAVAIAAAPHMHHTKTTTKRLLARSSGKMNIFQLKIVCWTKWFNTCVRVYNEAGAMFSHINSICCCCCCCREWAEQIIWRIYGIKQIDCVHDHTINCLEFQ